MLLLDRGFYGSEIGVYHYPMKHVGARPWQSANSVLEPALLRRRALGRESGLRTFSPAASGCVYVADVPFRRAVAHPAALRDRDGRHVSSCCARLGISIEAAAFGQHAVGLLRKLRIAVSKLPILFSISLAAARAGAVRFVSRERPRALRWRAVLAMQWILGEPTVRLIRPWRSSVAIRLLRMPRNSKRFDEAKRIAAAIGMANRGVVTAGGGQLLPAIDVVREPFARKNLRIPRRRQLRARRISS